MGESKTSRAHEILLPHECDVVIFHHPCQDGCAAAYAAWSVLGEQAKFHRAMHGSKPPGACAGKNVVLLDFCYPRALLQKLLKSVNKLLILDHHITSVEQVKGMEEHAVLDMEKSGAVLAWEYFHPNDELPLLFKYVQDKDLWQWKLPDSEEFNTAFSMVPFEPEAYHEFVIDESKIHESIAEGRIMSKYARFQREIILRRHTIRRLKGYRVGVVNAGLWSSELGNELCESLKNEIDLAAIWSWDAKNKASVVSLRTLKDTVDVAGIAGAYGGGGHQKASAFQYKGHIENLFDD